MLFGDQEFAPTAVRYKTPDVKMGNVEPVSKISALERWESQVLVLSVGLAMCLSLIASLHQHEYIGFQSDNEKSGCHRRGSCSLARCTDGDRQPVALCSGKHLYAA